jgi:hypothetical protein
MAGQTTLPGFLKAFFSHFGFTIIVPGDGVFMSFDRGTWSDASFLARKGSDIYVPMLVSNVWGAPLSWLRREIDEAGCQLVAIQPTDRLVETALKRTNAVRSVEEFGGVKLEVWRVPYRGRH